jgi:DNA-binding response OmpR family regulator
MSGVRASRVLVVEDARDLALGLRANLEVEGYDVAVAHTGGDAVRSAHVGGPDVVILDLMLPDIDGYEVLARLRGAGLDMPVLILTARGEEVDKVRGFRAGADDYLTKPFGVMELLVRIEALLRRAGGRQPSRNGRPAGRLTEARAVIRAGAIEVEPEARRVRRAGADVPLTPKAFELLLALLARDGRVASRHELLREVWGYDRSVTSRTVDTHVAELRRKLEADPAAPQHIETVWKIGYRWRA